MSPLQAGLYEKVERERVSRGEGDKGQHVFSALSYMRRLCTHPLLVLPSGSRARRLLEDKVRSEVRIVACIEGFYLSNRSSNRARH